MSSASRSARRSRRPRQSRPTCSAFATWVGSRPAPPRTSSWSTTTSGSSACSWQGRNVSLPEPESHDPGIQFLAEIHEQPDALLRLLEHQVEYARVAEQARERGATTVRMVGHGSSDNAASYGVYAFGLMPRWTAFRDSISLTVHYATVLDMRARPRSGSRSPVALQTSSATSSARD